MVCGRIVGGKGEEGSQSSSGWKKRVVCKAWELHGEKRYRVDDLLHMGKEKE